MHWNVGLSFDRMHEYLSWPADDLHPYRLAAQTQVIRVVAMVAAKVGGEAARERERQRIVSRMMRREFGDGVGTGKNRAAREGSR